MPTVLWRGWTTFTVPELPLLIVSDATPEALGLRLAEQDERLAVFDAEGGGLITMMGGQYGNRPNLDLLLKAHDGHPTTVVRVKNEEPHALMSPQLTIGVLSQREVLRQVMGVEGAFDRGLIARFLISATGPAGPVEVQVRTGADAGPVSVRCAAVIVRQRAVVASRPA
jgi:hypothetical protein